MPDDSRPAASAKASLLTAFRAALPQRVPGAAERADVEAFVSSIASDYRPEELPGVSLADLAGRAADLWAFAHAFTGAEPQVRVTADLDGATLIEIVQPDAPFLVDSVMGELLDAGAAVLAMFHPLLDLAAGRLSAIQVWAEPMGEGHAAELVGRLEATLADVHAAVADFAPMNALMHSALATLKAARVPDPEERDEHVAFLSWLDTGHFVFLGARSYTYPRNSRGGYAADEPAVDAGTGLGILREDRRAVLRRGSEPAVLSKAMRERLATAPPLVIAKANLKSVVHRRGYMDYIGVRRYGDDGKPVGEIRFVGLFTAQAYDEPVRNVPMIRRKVAHVADRAGLAPRSHNAMVLANILETFPRDELFEADEDELLATALGVLHLTHRPRVRLFVRNDPFDRFISVLFYCPRERYDERLREEVSRLLTDAYDGHVSSYYPSYTDAPLARVHYIIGVTPAQHPEPDLPALERQIARLARTWTDDFEAEVRRRTQGEVAPAILAVWSHAFPPGYRDLFTPAEALADVIAIGRLSPREPVAIRAFRHADDPATSFRIKLYRETEPIALADVLPVLDNMGLKALSEDGFALTPLAGDGHARRKVWTHEFVLDDPRGAKLSFEAVREVFEAAFLAVWSGQAENDGFNRLVLELSLPWRSAALVRALARYRQQSGLDPSPQVQQQALSDHTQVTGLILKLFAERLDPAFKGAEAKRDQAAEATRAEIEEALQAVESLDDDRVLRRLAALVGAIQRTNFYQPGPDGAPKPYISFKVSSRELADLPDPKPYREIYVSSPQVEGVHLRLGPVARGGLRWSDRRDDFRTEILGLVKAQQVKNAVIVPVGSKGGFFPKRLPRGGSPADVRAEAVSAYKTFLFGLLDLTDSIDADGKVTHPENVIIRDGDDPYLVVAADKGTATFSDIANGVAQDYGFWLGDAFASGGSAGYDHKAMGITARGAWEGVKRHFRELGKDIQTEPFSCVGVGDMSGDVFGNGMLLSKQIRLIAAFDHRHIFIDPDPDAAKTWTERKRMFGLAASSWDDFDRKVISKGGGVFARTLKSIALSPEAKAALDIKADSLTPAELMTAILKARAELLYLGGIGTYVKASAENNLQVGDKANDAIRIDGRDLRVRVVGEGANLGFTQAGRIEYALAGGRIDTDAIDNSAGVDTSDHEVNIKILTGMAERSGKLKAGKRDALLASMTGEIAGHVLSHNYDQTLALSILQAESVADLGSNAAFMDDLEARGRLDRRLEGLPDAAAIAERGRAGRGLTRPELAVLLAYGKLDLFAEVIESDAPDDPYFEATLTGYFPKELGPFEAAMRQHRLRREIIATVLCNETVNICGPTFARRLTAAAGCGVGELMVSFAAAREVLDFDEIWARVAALDGKAPAAGQTALFRELAYTLRGQTYWMARWALHGGHDVAQLIKTYRPAAQTLKALFPQILSPFEQKAAVRRASGWIRAGAPKEIAHQVALYRMLTNASVLAELAGQKGWSLDAAARLYHHIGGAFAFDRLRAAAAGINVSDHYERMAVRRLIEDLREEQAALTQSVMSHANGAGAKDQAAARAAVAAWTGEHAEAIRLARATIAGIEKEGTGWSFAKLTIANASLRALT